MANSVARRRAALATRHGKELILGPIFNRVLNWDVELADVDTDAFGTFSGDVPRLMSPRDTALAKATRARQQNGISLGLASEGSIGPHPYLPLVNADVEIVACSDTDFALDIVESHSSTNIVAARELWSLESDIEEFSRRADLPNHAVIVTNLGAPVTWVRKGLRDPEEILRAIQDLAREAPTAQAVVESDFRAMCSPSRQENIRACAAKLAERIASLCPDCGAPGWGSVGVEYGLACRDCGETVMDAVRADVLGCQRCPVRVAVDRPAQFVDPVRCPACNP